MLLLVIYVDYMLMASNINDQLTEINKGLQEKFKLTDIGEAKTFLGIEIKWD